MTELPHPTESEPGDPDEPPRALIIGVTSQDGVHLARQLDARGYHLLGTTRNDGPHPFNVYLPSAMQRAPLDLENPRGFSVMLEGFMPHEVYLLAGFTSPGRSAEDPALVRRVNVDAIRTMLTDLVAYQHSPFKERPPRVLLASSALAATPDANPYAASKAEARAYAELARAGDDLAVSVATLHNHESILRGRDFVTRKITRAVAEIALGHRDHLVLGNLDAVRDWGAAADYTRAMWATLQTRDVVDPQIATGTHSTLRELGQLACDAAGLGDFSDYVSSDPALMRSSDDPPAKVDVNETERLIGWRATTPLAAVIAHMVDTDIARLTSNNEESGRYMKEL